MKNSVCDTLGMPLLRIGDDFFRRVGQFILLGWLAEVWFLYDAFNAAQEAGSVAYDECFDYSAILSFAYQDGGRLIEIDSLDPAEQVRQLWEHQGQIVVTRPFDPFLPSRALISRAFERDICREPAPNEIAGTDPKGFHVALAALHVGEDRAIIGTARVRSFRFPPVSPTELAIELAVVDAAEKLKRYRQGSYEPLPTTEVDGWQNRIERWNCYR